MIKGKHRGNILLLAVLAGFCIMAIAEIIHGQAQIRTNRERLEIEEERRRALQELKAEQNNSGGDSGAETGLAESMGEKNGRGNESETAEDERRYDMQIVFMGDSILDRDRENGGVASFISDVCNARVYNMAIDGTTAAVLPDEPDSLETWQSRGLLGVVHAIAGDISPDIFEGYEAGEVLKECDFSETDYFVIEYGINDFLSGQVPQSIYPADGSVLDMSIVRTYVGALETAVALLHDHFPDAKIVLIAPHFCNFFEDGKFIGDAYSLNYGHGRLIDFAGAAEYVKAQDKEGVIIFYDTIEYSGINAYTADEYLEDGVNLSEEGCRVYADYASKLIKADFYRPE